jgi:hypothetical protein
MRTLWTWLLLCTGCEWNKGKKLVRYRSMIVDLTSLIYCHPKFTMGTHPDIRYCNYIRNYVSEDVSTLTFTVNTSGMFFCLEEIRSLIPLIYLANH